MKKLKYIIAKIKYSWEYILLCNKYIYKYVTINILSDICKEYNDYTFTILSICNQKKYIYKIRYNRKAKLFDLEFDGTVFTIYNLRKLSLSDYIIIQDIEQDHRMS